MAKTYEELKKKCDDIYADYKGMVSLEELIGKECEDTVSKIYDWSKDSDAHSLTKKKNIEYINRIISDIDQELLRLSLYQCSSEYISTNTNYKLDDLLEIKYCIIKARDEIMLDNINVLSD